MTKKDTKTLSKERVTLEGVRFAKRNFAGAPDDFNPSGGKRSFLAIIENVTDVKKLEDLGYNVRQFTCHPDDKECVPDYYLPVTVKYGTRPPNINLIMGDRATPLDETTVMLADSVSMLSADIVIGPYDWSTTQGSGRTAYLQTAYINCETDQLQEKYADMIFA